MVSVERQSRTGAWCVHGLAPAYLADALQPVAGLPGRQRLRSSSTSALAVPLTPTGST